MFGRKNKGTEIVPAEAVEQIKNELTTGGDINLPAVEAMLDNKIAALENRIMLALEQQLETVARYTRGNQSMAEIAAMDGNGTNIVLDPDAAEEFERRASREGRDLKDPMLTKREAAGLITGNYGPAQARLGRGRFT